MFKWEEKVAQIALLKRIGLLYDDLKTKLDEQNLSEDK